MLMGFHRSTGTGTGTGTGTSTACSAMLLYALLLESAVLSMGFVDPAGFVARTSTITNISASSMHSHSHSHSERMSRMSRMSANSKTKLQMSSRPGFRALVKSILPKSLPIPLPLPKSIRQPQPQSSQETYDAMDNDLNVNIPRVAVRPRPLVSLDEATGRYIPQLQTSDAAGTTMSSTSQSNDNTNHDFYSDQQFSRWNSFKDLVYDSIDRVSIIPKFIARSINTSSNTSKPRRNLAVAYSDTVEFKTQSATNFGASILADDGYGYGSGSRSRSRIGTSSTSSTHNARRPKRVGPGPGPGPAVTLVRQYESSLSSSSRDRSDGEDLYRSESRKSFDKLKDGIYDFFTGDDASTSASTNAANAAAAAARDTNKQAQSTTKKTPLQNLSFPSSSSSSPEPQQSEFRKDIATFKPISKPSTNKDITLTNIKPYLADLDSPNPVKVLKAKYAIASEERKQKRRIQEQKTRDTVDGVKQNLYNVMDAIQTFYTLVLNLPKQIDDTIQAAEYALEQTVDQTIKTAKEVEAIPSKVQQAVEDTKQSVRQTKQATIGVVQDVKNIPQTIEKRVADTKQSIKETKEGVENFVQKVEDLTFEAKVVAGLEQPKPKPPPPPPPPKSNKEIAMDVASVVAKTTGKAAVGTAVVVGKGTIGLTTSAMKVAYNAAKANQQKGAAEKKNKEGDEGNKQPKVSLLSKFAKTVNGKKKEEATKSVEASTVTAPLSLNSNVADTPKTIGEIDPLLEMEVADALRSAEEALDTVKQEKENPSSELTTLQINEALEKAKSAAAEARKDAEELQSMLQKRKKDHFFKP